MTDVSFFIAYARPDRPAAEALYAALSVTDEVFLDRRSIAPGEAWPEAVARALSAARVIVVLLGNAGQGRGYLSEEIIIALDAARADPARRVVPIHLRGREVPARLPYGLRRVQALFFESEGSWPAVARRLTGLVPGAGRPPSATIEVVVFNHDALLEWRGELELTSSVNALIGRVIREARPGREDLVLDPREHRFWIVDDAERRAVPGDRLSDLAATEGVLRLNLRWQSRVFRG